MSTQGAGPKSDPRLQSGVPVGQTAGLYGTKPKPIIAGESQALGIAMFSYRASYEDLTPERRGGTPESERSLEFFGMRDQRSRRGSDGGLCGTGQTVRRFGRTQCTLIGGGNANVCIYAASANTALVRYVDLMDSYLGPVSLCHPSDNVGAVLARLRARGAIRQRILDRTLAVAYQVRVGTDFCRSLYAMEEGFDLTTPLSHSQ